MIHLDYFVRINFATNLDLKCLGAILAKFSAEITVFQ